MPPRYAYWTILVDDQPTAFRSGAKEDLLPTFNRLKEKHASATMMWFQNGKLWPSRLDAQEAMRARGEMGRRGDSRQGGSFRDRPSSPRAGRPTSPRSSDRPDWTPKAASSQYRKPASPQARERTASDKLDWKPKGAFIPAPKRSERPERPERSEWKPKSSFDRERKPDWKPKGSFDRDRKAEWKPKASADRDHKTEWKPKASSDRDHKTEWKPKASSDRDHKTEWKPKPSFDRDRKTEWKPKASADRDRKTEWKPKGSFDRDRKTEWKPKASADRDRKTEWKAKGSFDRDRKPEWKPKESFDGDRKTEWKPKASFDRDRKPEWKPRGKAVGANFSSPAGERKPRSERLEWSPKSQDPSPKSPEKRKWIPKEEYKKSQGIEARRDSKWRPGGEHRDPRQKYKDAKKAKWSRFKQNIRQKWDKKPGRKKDDDK